MAKELVMYSRTFGCPFVTTAKRVLSRYDIPYREIFIDQENEARERVLNWTGFLSVPTLIVAEPGADLPTEEPSPLPQGSSPRGIDRGVMITEPSEAQFTAWLTKHAFITQAEAAQQS
jgi:glutaredoxin